MKRALILLIPLVVMATEREEQQRLLDVGKYIGQQEVVLWDGSRPDIIGCKAGETDTFAIEIDWSKKWTEGIGQCLYYSILTGYKPAIMLLYKDIEKEKEDIFQCQTVCAKYDIRMFLEKAEAKNDDN